MIMNTKESSSWSARFSYKPLRENQVLENRFDLWDLLSILFNGLDKELKYL